MDPFVENLDRVSRYRNDIQLQYHRSVDAAGRAPNSYAERVKSVLLDGLGNSINLETVAQQLHCSSSTLRRRLKAENLTYRCVLCQFRYDVTLLCLEEGCSHGKTIAEILGYSEVNTFYRAIKIWSGMSFGRLKKQRIVVKAKALC